MANTLRELSLTLGLKNYGAYYYGDYQGYVVTLTEKLTNIILSIAITFPNDDVKADSIRGFVENYKRTYNLVDYTINHSSISMTINDSANARDKLLQLLNKTVGMLEYNKVPGNDVCYFCEKKLQDNYVKAQIEDAFVNMHDKCVDELSRIAEKERNDYIAGKKNYGRGFIGALIGGLIGTIPWIIVDMLGFIVGILGALIGYAAKFGYEKLGGKPRKGKAWILGIVVLFCIIFAQFASTAITLVMETSATGYSLGDLITTTAELIAYSSSLRRSMIINIVIGIVFAGASLAKTFTAVILEGTSGFVNVKKLTGIM